MVIPPILVFCFYHTPFNAKPQEAISTSCDFLFILRIHRVWDIPKIKKCRQKAMLAKKMPWSFSSTPYQNKKHRHWICKSSVGALSAF